MSLDKKNKLKKFIKLLSTITVILIIVCQITSRFIYLNVSSSMPKGFYILVSDRNDKINKNNIVLYDTTKNEFIKKYYKGYEDKMSKVFIKYVAGTKGDIIEVTDDAMKINNNKTFIKIKGERMSKSSYPNCKRELKENELILVGEHLFSYDSRYYGIVNQKDILGVLRPLIVF